MSAAAGSKRPGAARSQGAADARGIFDFSCGGEKQGSRAVGAQEVSGHIVPPNRNLQRNQMSRKAKFRIGIGRDDDLAQAIPVVGIGGVASFENDNNALVHPRLRFSIHAPPHRLRPQDMLDRLTKHKDALIKQAQHIGRSRPSLSLCILLHLHARPPQRLLASPFGPACQTAVLPSVKPW